MPSRHRSPFRPFVPFSSPVLQVLYERFIAETRTDPGDFALKDQLIQVMDRVQVRWGPYGNSAEPTTVFSQKICR